MLKEEFMRDIRTVAEQIGIESALLAAIVHIESGARAYTLVDGRREPLIRFEGHYFDRRLSGGKQALARKLSLSSPKAGVIRNPPGQAARWALLARAEAIDSDAARESVSWGVGQVMGAHWAWLDYASIDALVTEARSGLVGQLRLMARYIDKAGLTDSLRIRDWQAFASGYNGPAYRKNAYDTKLARAYQRYSTQAQSLDNPLKVILKRGEQSQAVRDLQVALSRQGYKLEPDGIFGPQTQRAVKSFQAKNNLAVDGRAGPETLAAMNKPATTYRSPALLSRIFQCIQQRISHKHNDGGLLFTRMLNRVKNWPRNR